MRNTTIVAILAVSLLLLIGCTGGAAPTPTELPATPAATDAAPVDLDPTTAEELAQALTAAGFEVTTTVQEEIGFFDLSPIILNVGGQEIQVYQFADEATAQTAAGMIPDLLATSRWAAPPNFFHSQSLIALYVGEDAPTINALLSLLGPAIAGVGSEGGEAPGEVSQVSIYLIALEDNGATGDLIGCNDSVIPVTRDIAPTEAPIEAALTELFAIKEQMYGESGLYNALSQSELAVESATIDNGLATVYLTGTFVLGGECDTPRFKAQLEYTVLQFPGIEAVEIFINGTRMEELLSAEG